MLSNNSSNSSNELEVNLEFDLGDDLTDILRDDLRDDNGNTTKTNGTYLFHEYPVVVPLAIIMVIIIILAIVGNIMVILTILRHRGMRTRTNMFIVNLAVADILVAALDMPVSLITIIEGDWIFGGAMCQLNGFTMALFLICSIHTLMYISVHKFISITRPFSRAMTPRRIKIMILAAWLWSVFCATGPLIGWNKIKFKAGASQCGPAYPVGFKAKSHSVLITTSNYIIPLSVMIFCYSRIFREIHIHMKRIRKTSNIDLENSVQQQKKVATTLFLVLACFLLCWTPFVMYSNAILFIGDTSKIPSVLNPLAYWCGYINSACNPIIYAFRSPSFRKGYKEIMCGASASGLSAVNSLSFRSRSARGSQKSNSNVNIGNSVKIDDSRKAVRRQRTMLSQTSWRSLPLVPSLIRTFSTKNGGRQDDPDSPPVTPSGCGMCGLWKPRPSSYHARGTDDQEPPEENNIHSLNDIKEGNTEDDRNYGEVLDSDDDRECDEIHENNKDIKDREESV